MALQPLSNVMHNAKPLPQPQLGSPPTTQSRNRLNIPLAKQRLNRPASPHMTIYRPRVTWVVSITTRITGVILLGGLYLYATAYLASDITGWEIQRATKSSCIRFSSSRG
ncbi:succinate:quinone oxidoreductase subunit C [Aspergillus undulatus]|uniref:succinate:quinone oxidoreductase subunit C n=1 Tax=Aspergillus undulatus TaxID=1810928 RepID=UPI003CCD1B7B